MQLLGQLSIGMSVLWCTWFRSWLFASELSSSLVCRGPSVYILKLIIVKVTFSVISHSISEECFPFFPSLFFKTCQDKHPWSSSSWPQLLFDNFIQVETRWPATWLLLTSIQLRNCWLAMRLLLASIQLRKCWPAMRLLLTSNSVVAAQQHPSFHSTWKLLMSNQVVAD